MSGRPRPIHGRQAARREAGEDSVRGGQLSDPDNRFVTSDPAASYDGLAAEQT